MMDYDLQSLLGTAIPRLEIGDKEALVNTTEDNYVIRLICGRAAGEVLKGLKKIKDYRLIWPSAMILDRRVGDSPLQSVLLYISSGGEVYADYQEDFEQTGGKFGNSANTTAGILLTMLNNGKAREPLPQVV